MGNKRSKNQSHLILTDYEIDILESKTGLSRQEIQAWHSQFLQDNPSGYIDKKHFDKIYHELYPNGNSEMSSYLAFQVANNLTEINLFPFVLLIFCFNRRSI